MKKPVSPRLIKLKIKNKYKIKLTDQSVNCILPENTCFICYIIPNLWIKRTATVLIY